MNRKLLKKIATKLEHQSPIKIGDMEVGFNMSRFASDSEADKLNHKCKTTGCIAGWAIALTDPEFFIGSIRYESPAPDQEAQDILKLTTLQAAELFYGSPTGTDLHKVKPIQAARTIRHLLKTGKVEWDEANA